MTDVLGLNVIWVDGHFAGKLPVAAVTHVGYIVALVVVSSVMPMFSSIVAVPLNVTDERGRTKRSCPGVVGQCIAIGQQPAVVANGTRPRLR